MRKVWIGSLVLAMSLVLLLGGVMAAARAGPDGYSCLRIPDVEGTGERVFDLSTGFWAEIRGSTSIRVPQPAVGSWVSPDSLWIAYARPTSPVASQAYSIFVAPGDQVPGTDESATLLTVTIGLFDLGWQPGGDLVALLWRDAANSIFLTTASPTGEHRIDRQVPNGSVNDVRFHGWSADGRFLATSSGVMSAAGESIQVWRAADGSTVAPGLPPAGLPLIEYASWAPVGARLAYLRGHASSTETRLVVVAPDEQPVELDFDIPQSAVAGRPKWSPDGQRLALATFEGPDLRISVFDLRDGRLIQTGNAVIASRLVWPVSFVWSADSGSVIFWGDQPGARDLAAYRIDDGQIDLLVGDVWLGPGDPLSADPNPAGGPRRAVVAYRSPDGTFAADVLDVDGVNRTRLFFNARTAGDAFWSPDGEITIIRWTTQDGLSIQPWLTWARRDGSDLHHLQDVAGEYMDLLWLPGSRQLAYVLSERGRLAVEVLDLEQNVRYQLVRGLEDVHGLEYDDQDGQLRFWWRNARNESGTDAFMRAPDGEWKSHYRFRVPAVIAGGYRLERAPTGPYAVLIPASSAQDHSYLATEDGLWSHPLDGRARYSTAVSWSPDGTRLAILYDSLVLSVFDTQGEPVGQTPLTGPFGGVPVFTRCD